MKRHTARLITALTVCAAFAAPGCASAPKEPAAPSAQVSASQTAAPQQTVLEAPQPSESAEQSVAVTFFTSPLDSETAVKGVVFPYSSYWVTLQTESAVKFTENTDYPSSVFITADPVTGTIEAEKYADDIAGTDTEKTIEALKQIAAAEAADAGVETDLTEESSMAGYPAVLYAYTLPEDETMQIAALATDGQTLYKISAAVPMGRAGASATAQDAENMMRDILFFARTEAGGIDWGDILPSQGDDNSTAVFGITASSVDSSLAGDIVTGPGMGIITQEPDSPDSVEFRGISLTLPEGAKTTGNDADTLSISLEGYDGAQITVTGGTPDAIGVYGTPQDWLDGEFDDMTAHGKDIMLTIKQTGFCRAGDIYEAVCAADFNGLSLNADALLTAGADTYYRFSMSCPLTKNDTAGQVNGALGLFSDILFGAVPLSG